MQSKITAWSKLFQIPKIKFWEKNSIFSPPNASFRIALKNSPVRDIWISISQEAERDQNEKEGSLKFTVEPGWPRQMAALNPRTVKMRLKAKLERDEIWVSFRGSAFWRRGGDGRGSLSLPLPGRSRQIKDFCICGRSLFFHMFILQLESALHETLQGQTCREKGCHSRPMSFIFFPPTHTLQGP